MYKQKTTDSVGITISEELRMLSQNGGCCLLTKDQSVNSGVTSTSKNNRNFCLIYDKFYQIKKFKYGEQLYLNLLLEISLSVLKFTDIDGRIIYVITIQRNIGLDYEKFKVPPVKANENFYFIYDTNSTRIVYNFNLNLLVKDCICVNQLLRNMLLLKIHHCEEMSIPFY